MNNLISTFSVFKLLTSKIGFKKSNGIRRQSLANVAVEGVHVVMREKTIFLFLPDEEKILSFSYDFF